MSGLDAEERGRVDGEGTAGSCPLCAHPMAVGDSYCSQCGWSNNSSRAPLDYTPPQLAERILKARTGLDRERKQVTILFADVKDSMDLVTRDPEEALQLLDPVLQLMMDAVHRNDGIVNQVMGDGIMAIFGAPLGYEDHAMRACRAALGVQESMRRLNDREPAGRQLGIRVGLNSGEVVVRTIGNDLRMDYSAVGQTTHLAARMEQLATPGTILLTAATQRLVEGMVQVRAVGLKTVRGLARPVEAFELLGVWSSRTRWQARAARGLSPFTGRESSLATLYKAADLAMTGRGQLAAVVGEPGVGKSRLVWEFLAGARNQGWLVLETAAMSQGRTTVFRPLADLLRTYFAIDERTDPGAVRTAVAEHLQRVDPFLERALPALLDLMRVPFDDTDWRQTEPTQRKERTLDAIQSLLVQQSHRRPLLLVVEDLHWVDSPTQEVLDRLIKVLAGAPILLVITYRPEYRHPWTAHECYRQIRLAPLAPEVADALLDVLLGANAQLARLKRALVERTEGNPFFLEECVRALIASKVVVAEGSAYRLVADFTDVEVPMTVHAVLAARIDRLAPLDKRLLQTLSVIGRHAPRWLIDAVADIAAEEVQPSLARLEAAAFLVEGTAFAEAEYTLSHALTQEVVYSTVLVERRRGLHRNVVEAMERHYGERRSEHAELLGHHAVNGELWERAVGYLREAGARAMSRSEYAEAMEFYKESLLAAGRLAEGPNRIKQEIDIRFELRNVLWAVGRLAEGLEYLHEAEPFAIALGDRKRLARLAAHKLSNHLVLGENERALKGVEEAFTRARDLGDFALIVDTNLFLGVLYTSLGDFHKGLGHLDSIAAALAGDQRRGYFGDFYAVHGQTWRVWCLAELGRFAEAQIAADQGMRIAEGSGHSHNIVAASWALGYLARTRGEVENSVVAFKRAHSVCQAAGVNLWLRPSAAMLGEAYARHGQVADGIRLLEVAARPTENNVGLAAWTAALAESYARAGLIDEAREAADRAVALAERRNEAGFAAHSLRVRALIAALAGQTADARKSYRDALVIAGERAMLPLAARCHAALMDLEAGGHKAAARNLCERMQIDLRQLVRTDPVSAP